MKQIIIAVIVYLSCGFVVRAQNVGTMRAESHNVRKLVFSVASIKPSKPDSDGWRMDFTPDGFSARNIPLRKVIQEAYGIYDEERLSPGPDRVETTKFDIEAKIDDATDTDLRALTLDQRRLMLQALLQDRFGLSMHHELKDLPVYGLVLSKNTPKLQRAASEVNSFDNIKGHDALVVHSGHGTLEVKSFAMSDLALSLHASAGRIVVDETGLPGRYDFTLKWSPMSDPLNDQNFDTSAPSIFTALQEQLGLKLEPKKYPIDTIVIDHLELPSAN